jgi:hypothetical protein
MDFHEVHATEGDLEDMFNPTASIILKWRMIELLRWMQNLYQLALDYQGLSLHHCCAAHESVVVKLSVSLLQQSVKQNAFLKWVCKNCLGSY